LPKYKFQEPIGISEKSTGWCSNCGRRREESKHVKVFQNWVCDLVQLDNGHWIHSSRIYDAELSGRRVVYRLIEDV
jgi:hypothetical protein